MPEFGEITTVIADMWATRLRQSKMHSHLTMTTAKQVMQDLHDHLDARDEFMCGILMDMYRGDKQSDAGREYAMVVYQDLQAVMRELAVVDSEESGPLDVILEQRPERDYYRTAYKNGNIRCQVTWRKNICQAVLANLES